MRGGSSNSTSSGSFPRSGSFFRRFGALRGARSASDSVSRSTTPPSSRSKQQSPIAPLPRVQLYECLSCGEKRTIKNRGECVKCRVCDFRVLLKVQSKTCVSVSAR